MKYTVIVNGRFQAFDYASELHKQGKLDKLISSMPYYIAKKYNIPSDKYEGFPIFEYLKYSSRKVLKKNLPTMLYAKAFTKWAKTKIPKNTNVIFSSAGYSYEIFTDKQFQNVIKVLDRPSTHTLSNIELKKEAYRYHNSTFTPHKESFVKRELEEYKNANKIMIPSSFVERTFLDNGIKQDKIIKIPYPIGNNKFKNLTKTDSKREKSVLFVGQLSPRKGIQVLLDAFKIIDKKNNEIFLNVVGHRVKDYNVNFDNYENVKYLGPQKGQALYDIFNTSSLFCLPAYEEGMAFVLSEANYCGLPIIATKNSSIEDFKVNNSKSIIEIPTGDPEVLAENIMSFFEEGLKQHSFVSRSHESVRNYLEYTNKIINEIEK
ncbi:glycosyltransferase family 4 protein [Flammeovirga sp. SJP92]|uniref:glycosyltransferase family 4 protein n=1 Tax=Flammeovirga sp. SJP92 TaxID=1775430 RepID=UPI00078690FC|nr:glycosyltransferase family 4 protein [Flammeovirga sp. SJP92]KXX72546.1 hypothetical protein AVL50_00305 [Flammeovirga sp. SJP92]